MSDNDKWYDELPDDAAASEAGKIYEKAFRTVHEGLTKGLGFDEACASLDIADETLRASVIDDIFKVLIAEEHFGKNMPLETLSGILKVPVSRLESAREEMFEDIKDASAKEFYRHLHSGNA